MNAESTFILLKPDCVQRGLVGEVIRHFEGRFAIRQLAWLHLTPRDVEFLYVSHALLDGARKQALCEFMTEGPVVCAHLCGDDAVFGVRSLAGTTHLQPQPGTIRGIYGRDHIRNVIHVAESAEAAQRELNYFFGKAGQGVMDVSPQP